MSSPKLLRIVDAVAARLEAISQGAGYYTDIGCKVRKSRREPSIEDTPCVNVVLGTRTVTEARNERQSCEQQIIIVGYLRLMGVETEVLGIEMLADIQKAVELEDETVGGLLLGAAGGLQFAGDFVVPPEPGEQALAVQVNYSIPHMRRSGDPEIA